MLRKDLGNRALLVLLFRTPFGLGFFLSQMAPSDACFLMLAGEAVGFRLNTSMTAEFALCLYSQDSTVFMTNVLGQ